METFSALLAICVGNSPVPGEFPAQRPVTRSFDVFFDLRPNKQLSKQWWGWWFETPSWSLWRHRNGLIRCGLVTPYGFRQPEVCRLFGAEPLPELVLTWSGNKFQCNFNQNTTLYLHWKCHLQIGGHFIQVAMCFTIWIRTAIVEGRLSPGCPRVPATQRQNKQGPGNNGSTSDVLSWHN